MCPMFYFSNFNFTCNISINPLLRNTLVVIGYDIIQQEYFNLSENTFAIQHLFNITGQRSISLKLLDYNLTNSTSFNVYPGRAHILIFDLNFLRIIKSK